MIENEHKITPAITPDPPELLLAEVEVREKDPKQPHREKTAGEKAFDRGVYTGIGFGVNELSAIFIADEFQNRSGKKLFNNISEWMVKAFKLQDTIQKGVPVSALSVAQNKLLWLSILISGTALVWPMKKLEDNKNYWVKKANHYFDHGKLTPEETAQRDTQVEKAIACEAKQTWPSLILGRIIAIGTVMGVGTLIGKQNTDKILNWSEKLLAGSIQSEGRKGRWNSYAAITAIETIGCTTSSITLEIMSKLFAKRFKTVHNPELCTAIVHENDAAANGGSTDSKKDDETKQITPCAPCAIEAQSNALDALKKKPIVKMENHVDAVKASEASYTLAP